MRISAVLSLFALVLAFAVPASAVIVCHDYTYWRVTGIDPRPVGTNEPQGISVTELREMLKAKGYTSYKFSNAISNPEAAQRILKPGFVLIIRDDHSGFVKEGGFIDHFIQRQDEIGRQNDPTKLPRPTPGTGVAGGFFEGDTLRLFLSRPFRQDPMIVEVWRK